MKSNRDWYLQGAHDGLPIAMGYLAVSFTLGIAARNVGLGAFPASLMSITNLTSAGQFAALGLITAGTSYVEMACTQLIINLRYFLMSCALSQKLDPNMHFFHRLLVAYGVTDEIFGISIGSGRMLNPFYAYGAISVAAPSWTLGTFLGVVSGNVLPARLAGLVAVSMAASLLFTLLPVVSQISTGMRIIILTVLVAGAGAVLFPVEEAEEKEELHEA